MTTVKVLNDAKRKKNDEFYTRLCDIEAEVAHYADHFKNKVVYLNADNPSESKFWEYFHRNFSALGLRKLVSTFLNGNFVSVYEGGNDDDITSFEKNISESNGSFDSEESIKQLKAADIVVTNPPFSLFQKFISLLFENKKDFIVVCSPVALMHQFQHIKEGRLHAGIEPIGFFTTPSGEVKHINACWASTLTPTARQPDFSVFNARYIGNEGYYPPVDNFDAINVNKLRDIPKDYIGDMAVPVTVLSHFDIAKHFDFKCMLGDGKTRKYHHGKVYLNGKELFGRVVCRYSKNSPYYQEGEDFEIKRQLPTPEHEEHEVENDNNKEADEVANMKENNKHDLTAQPEVKTISADENDFQKAMQDCFSALIRMERLFTIAMCKNGMIESNEAPVIRTQETEPVITETANETSVQDEVRAEESETTKSPAAEEVSIDEPPRKKRKGVKNDNLRKAKEKKFDEFYTLLKDIENEMQWYEPHFKDAVIYCNCDNPEFSNFWRFFHTNFTRLGLKKLISTFYDEKNSVYKSVYSGGNDEDIQVAEKTMLAANGDFRSSECVEILKEADIVVSNPPFSLFREYITLLNESGKKFIIVGNINASSTRAVFPLIQSNGVKIGNGFEHKAVFKVPEGFVSEYTSGVFDERDNTVSIGNCVWYTNLSFHSTRPSILQYSQTLFDEDKYQKYDGLDVINIDKLIDFPIDYTGTIGVPVTFLKYYKPEEYTLLGVNCEELGVYKNVLTINGEKKYKRFFVKKKVQENDEPEENHPPL